MIAAIEKMPADFAGGRLTRRQITVSLAALVAGAQPAQSPGGLRAVSLNHVTVRVPDLQRTSRFYQEFFGMPLKQHSKSIHILGVGKSFFGIQQDSESLVLITTISALLILIPMKHGESAHAIYGWNRAGQTSDSNLATPMALSSN